MAVTTYHKEYSEVKQAYLEVKSFLKAETGEEDITLKTQIGNDIGYDGDDSLELLEKFITKYGLDIEGFDFSKHFLTEGEIADGVGPILHLIFLPITILIWLVKLLSFGRINLTKEHKFPDIYRDTLDLSFGDMLTWYLAGRFTLRKEVRFQIANAV
ncbi:MAG TPA: DUF1493 family protein [Flavisolibacter sp.]|nr:DUF1493 family protein [Flavisolibacter sp.]